VAVGEKGPTPGEPGPRDSVLLGREFGMLVEEVLPVKLVERDAHALDREDRSSPQACR
jgi:hypothetical protein